MTPDTFSCPHCAAPVAHEGDFCCPGCAAAYQLIKRLGLQRYYSARALRADTPLPTPGLQAEAESAIRFTTCDKDGECRIFLTIEGLHCGACVWLIEQVLLREPHVTEARLNMTTRRLTLRWRGDIEQVETLISCITGLGYRARPYDPAIADDIGTREQKALLRALAVAGFAAGNIMLLSVGLWSSTQEEMGVATRDLLHWVEALIALPTLVYAGQPFFRSAWRAITHWRGSMDIPISLALIASTLMSLYETLTHGEHAYFDSASMLLFFLLTGRYLDRRARNKARSAAQDLLGVMASAATVLKEGVPCFIPAHELAPGMRLLVASGERVLADGRVEEGVSSLDTSLITGESLPRAASAGTAVFAGDINLDAPLTIAVTAAREDSLLAEIVRLMEQAEQGQARYVRLADRVAHYYTPVVHLLGLATLIFWWLVIGRPWQEALLTGITVLIVTCPCALALAVPVVQVVASGRLFSRGILLKSGDALERLANIDGVVFDKTGTLTLGQPELTNRDILPEEALAKAAALAATSRHPLARALLRAYPQALPAGKVREYPGQGLESEGIRLGKREFAAPHAPPASDSVIELWMGEQGKEPVRFLFSDPLRKDAPSVIASLAEEGLSLRLLSGDREEAVREVAETCGIDSWKAQQKPDEKLLLLSALNDQGHKLLMVGDGLNDAPALAAASVSMSPSTALDITQNTADIVFQGTNLSPVLDTWRVARHTSRLVRQNIAFSLAYNLVAVPLAMAGAITPLIAAAAMSASSLVVILNALRLNTR